MEIRAAAKHLVDVGIPAYNNWLEWHLHGCILDTGNIIFHAELLKHLRRSQRKHLKGNTKFNI